MYNKARRYPRKNLSKGQKVARLSQHYTKLGRELRGIQRSWWRKDIRARELARQRYYKGVFVGGQD